MAVGSCIWYVVVPFGVCVSMSIESQSVTPVSHSDTRGLNSLLEKWMGLQCCFISVSYSLVPMVHCMVLRL